jgi:hypothetical protein
MPEPNYTVYRRLRATSLLAEVLSQGYRADTAHRRTAEALALLLVTLITTMAQQIVWNCGRLTV